MAGTGANERTGAAISQFSLNMRKTEIPGYSTAGKMLKKICVTAAMRFYVGLRRKAAAGPENAFRCKFRSRRGVLLSSDGLVEVQENAREGEPFILGIIADNLRQAGALGV